MNCATTSLSMTQSVGYCGFLLQPLILLSHDCVIVFNFFSLFPGTSRQSFCHEVITLLICFLRTSILPPFSSVNMKTWRWQGIAGLFRVEVGMLLLGLSLAQSIPPQDACPKAMALQNLTQPQYQDTTSQDTGFMTALVQSFLHTVQPNPFPEGQCHSNLTHQSNLGSLCHVQIY